MFNDDHLPMRFWNKVALLSNGCWEWTASRNAKGYGNFRWQGGMKLSHRVAFAALRGPLSDDLVIDHLCRNRACVNPSHMEQVTQAINVERGETWAINGTKTHCSNGHEFSGDNLLHVSKSSGGRQRRCRQCRNDSARAYMRGRRAALAAA